VFEYAWLILLFPLFAFLIIGLFGRRFGERVGWISVAFVFLSFVTSLVLFVQTIGLGLIGGEVLVEPKATWAWIPGMEMGLILDNLSVFLLLLVSFLSFLIVLYSVGYMADDPGKSRYFAEVSLFVAGMLGTVSADNFLQLLIFWEIMGLCSYLLIGFWYHKPEAASAAKKAFLVTRIGDVLFLAGVLIIFIQFGTFRFEEIKEVLAGQWTAGLVDVGRIGLVAALLFGGAVGKSAQFPLHVWLPDAMEGPTPVSALIHAATMVKAGVYLVARSFLFLVPVDPATGEVILGAVPVDTILLIAILGGFTAFFAATMAVVNYDIKRVLAFSTISQLAYMFLALGAGALFFAFHGETEGFSAGLFHLMNHAFFKALLFLAAGSVIHAVHTNDMRKMGGLRKHMPITFATMTLGALALAGIPPFSGFWSKDEILAVTFRTGADNPLFYGLYVLAVATAFLTAFYTFRMIYMTFFGEYRGEGRPHESPRVMTLPLMILGFFAVTSGWFAFATNGFGNFVFYGEALSRSPAEPFFVPGDLALVALSVAMAVGGWALAHVVYLRRTIPAERFTATPRTAALHRLVSRRYGLDAAYDAFADKGYYTFARAWDWFDRRVVDGVVDASGRATVAAARANDWFDRRVIDGLVNRISLDTVRSSFALRQTQKGRVQGYAYVVVLGLAVIILLVFVTRLLLRALGG
jgi:NADH-quinone oxidoreductase subunit L